MRPQSLLHLKEFLFILFFSEDVVPNIRLKLVSLLPHMKATLALPEDKVLLQVNI